ncbi:hypothetical protein [Rothia sp. (in: high G+C Gram-positive bacteria)]|uniref:hypothetical protein n=1 Tax=Rothia sp. (in: high G+C Gram-positive bacteria) TaxID=1885016 RepID=UPI0032173E4F
MSNKIQTWAWTQPLKAGPKLALMALADESNDQGMVFLSREKLAMKVAGIDTTATPDEIDNATRSLRRNIKVLMEHNYMMAGRRQRKWTRGRAIDVIFLNVRGVPGVRLYDSVDDVPGELPNPYLMDETPVDNSSYLLPDNLSGKSIFPSQHLEDNLSGKPSKPSLTGQKVTSYRTKSDVLPDKSEHQKNGALIGTRARLTLNNPSNPQSVNQMEQDLNVLLTEGLNNQSIGAMPSGLAQHQLRSAMNRSYPGMLDAVDVETLDGIMRMLVNREERRGQQVKNPVGFCIKAIEREPGGISALVALANIERYTAQDQVVDEASASISTAPVAFCSEHTREYTGQCLLCLKEASGILPAVADETPTDVSAGQALLAQIRARRENKSSAA